MWRTGIWVNTAVCMCEVLHMQIRISLLNIQMQSPYFTLLLPKRVTLIFFCSTRHIYLFFCTIGIYTLLVLYVFTEDTWTRSRPRSRFKHLKEAIVWGQQEEFCIKATKAFGSEGRNRKRSHTLDHTFPTMHPGTWQSCGVFIQVWTVWMQRVSSPRLANCLSHVMFLLGADVATAL